ncbi:MAG: sugar phosphate nucleotidyltransferase [archaeon]
MKEKISITIDRGVLNRLDGIVDNVYIRNRSQAIEHVITTAIGEQRDAVILCGGKEDNWGIGAGMYRMTAIVGKESVIERAVKKLRENGFRRIFFVARHKILTKIFEILKDGSDYAVSIQYVEEKAGQGTADSLRIVKGMLSSAFLVVYGDIIFDDISIESLWAAHLRNRSVATLMLTTSNKPSIKGTAKVEGNKVLEFIQKPKESDVYLVFSPIFAVEPEIFNYAGHVLETDVFPVLATRGLLAGHLSSEKEFHIHSLRDAKRAE